jgi:hypothetical protein
LPNLGSVVTIAPGPRCPSRKGVTVFILVVALLFVLILGAIAFTDVVEEGPAVLKTAFAQFVRRVRTNEER